MADLRSRNKGPARNLRGIILASLFLTVGLGSLAGTIKLRMDRTERQQPYPQGILILDGTDPRIEFGLAFAKKLF